MAKKEWIIVEGITKGGAIEYQVSDGEAYDGTNDLDERTYSYDFTDLAKAKKLCNKLNKKGNNMKSKEDIREVLEVEKQTYSDGGETDDIIKGWIEALEYVLGTDDEV